MPEAPQNWPRVYVSVLNWNRYELTLRCLQSLQALDYPNYELIVVDNASTDGSAARIREQFPGVRLITSDTNLGYAGGNRLALDEAMRDETAELFWILNNDTMVYPDTLRALVETYQRFGDALYGGVPVHVSSDGQEPTIVMGVYQGRQYRMLRNVRFSAYFATREARPVEALVGSHLLIPISVIRRHGFMDETFFLYKEETDYCFRLRAAGVPNILAPASMVAHDDGGSHKRERARRLAPIIRYYRARNEIILFRRHFGLTGYLTQIARQLVYALGWLLLTVRRGRVAPACAYYTLLGVRDALRSRMGKTYAPEDFLPEG